MRPTVDEEAPRDALEVQIAFAWEHVLGRPRVGMLSPFSDVGGDAALAAALVHRLNRISMSDLPPSFPVLSSSIRDMAGAIRGRERFIYDGIVQAIRPAPDRPEVFLTHTVSGVIGYMIRLSYFLDPQWSLFGLQAVGLDGRDAPLDDIPAMARTYFDSITRAGHPSPFRFGGYSYGCFVAVELARVALQMGHGVEFVGLIAPPLPDHARKGFMPPASMLKSRYKRHLLGVEFERKITPETDTVLGSLYTAHLTASRLYRPSPVSLPCTIFQPSEDPQADDIAAYWTERLGADTRIHVIPGEHRTAMKMSRLPQLGMKFSEALAQAGRSVPSCPAHPSP